MLILIMQNPTFRKTKLSIGYLLFMEIFTLLCHQTGWQQLNYHKFHHHSRSDQHPRYQGPDTLVVGESECGNSSPEGGFGARYHPNANCAANSIAERLGNAFV